MMKLCCLQWKWKTCLDAHSSWPRLLFLSSGAMHSEIVNSQNYMQSRHHAICDYERSAAHALRGENNCGTPRFKEGPNLSMECLRNYWHWLKIRGLERTGILDWRLYASQRHISTCQDLRWHSISWSLIKSMMQCRIANYGEGRINCN
jgi:hypothetical protein